VYFETSSEVNLSALKGLRFSDVLLNMIKP